MKLWHLTERKNLKSILKHGLRLNSKQSKPSFTGKFGQELRQHYGCIYAFEHSSDAIQFNFGVGGWENDDRVLIAFHSDAERFEDPYCQCQSNARAIVIKVAVPAKDIDTVYKLPVKGYYKSHNDLVWQHRSVPVAKPLGQALRNYKAHLLAELQRMCQEKMKAKRKPKKKAINRYLKAC